MTSPDSIDLCDQRAEPENGDEDLLVCTRQLGHDDQGWHWDPVADVWWRRTADGVDVDI